jgi:hypothetical protein
MKVQLFQGCKSETEPINTKSVVQHVIRYRVLFAAYYKADTKYCCCHATCLSGHVVDFTDITHLCTIPSIVGDILQSRYQVLLLSCNMFVRSHCRLHWHHPFLYDTKCCWWHITKPIPSIVAVMQHVCRVTLSTSLTSTIFVRYQVLLVTYYKADTKYCCCHATCLSGHIVDFTDISHFCTIPSIVGDILQSRYQVLLLSCNMFVRSHCRLHWHQPFVYDTKYCWWHITKRFELNTVCRSLKRCKNGRTVWKNSEKP